MWGDIIHWRAAFNSFLIDATGEQFAYIIQIPKTGTITKVGFRTGTVTTPQTLRVGIQTLSAGDPSGSAYGSMVAGTQAAPASNTYYEVTLGTPATATRGDYVAVVIEFDSAIGNLNLAATTAWFNQNFPYVDLKAGAGPTWAKGGQHPVGHLGYSDGTYPIILGCCPVSAFTTSTYNSGSTPDERSLKFRTTVPTSVKGVLLRLGTSASGDFDVVLYDSDGTTALATKSVLAANALSTGNDLHRVLFNSSVRLRANTYYRLAVKPTSANNVNLIQIDVTTAALLDNFNGGQDFHLSTRTNAGAWTDTTTSKPGIELFVDQFHDGQVSDWISV